MPFRVRAFLLHLLGSAILALLSLYLVFSIWYPGPLYKLLGVTGIFLIILAVDVIVGPLLTLIVAKAGKKSLKFDLAVIICLQLTAFIYGTYTVAEGRPVWLVFTGDRFEVAQAYELNQDHLAKAAPAFANVPWLGPVWVGAKSPEDSEMRNGLLFASLAGGADLAQRPDLYEAYSSMASQIGSSALPLSNLERANDAETVMDVLRVWPEADVYLPLTHHRGRLTVLLKRDTAEVLAVVDLVP